MNKKTRALLIVVPLLALTFALAWLTSSDAEGCDGCGCRPAKAAAKPEKAELSTAALAALLKANTPAVILDARTAKWDDGRRIPGAKSLPVDAGAEKIKELLPKKDALVVTYCGSSKCPLSKKLAHRLGDLGYTNVVEYPEGIAGWVAAGQKFEQTKKAAPKKLGGTGTK